MEKVLDVILMQRDWATEVWTYERYDNPDQALKEMLSEMTVELEGFDVKLRCIEEELPVPIKGYGDLLNSMRICYPAAGVGSYCLGHIIGASKTLDIVEDLRRGINRVAFAPETVEPAGSDKVVCHNCGCGC
jgi:hypothetical protein